MSIHQLEDGRWIVHFLKGALPKSPKRTREYFGRGRSAERRARERNADLGLRG